MLYSNFLFHDFKIKKDAKLVILTKDIVHQKST